MAVRGLWFVAHRGGIYEHSLSTRVQTTVCSATGGGIKPPPFLWLSSEVQVESFRYFIELGIQLASDTWPEIHCCRMQGHIWKVFPRSHSPLWSGVLQGNNVLKHSRWLVWTVEHYYRCESFSRKPSRFFVAFKIAISTYSVGETRGGYGHYPFYCRGTQVPN